MRIEVSRRRRQAAGDENEIGDLVNKIGQTVSHISFVSASVYYFIWFTHWIVRLPRASTRLRAYPSVRSSARSFVRSFTRLFVYSSVRPVACLSNRSFDCSCSCLFVYRLIRSFARFLACLLIHLSVSLLYDLITI